MKTLYLQFLKYLFITIRTWIYFPVYMFDFYDIYVWFSCGPYLYLYNCTCMVIYISLPLLFWDLLEELNDEDILNAMVDNITSIFFFILGIPFNLTLGMNYVLDSLTFPDHMPADFDASEAWILLYIDCFGKGWHFMYIVKFSFKLNGMPNIKNQIPHRFITPH